MARNLADIALVEITTKDGGNKVLTTVISINVNKADPKTPAVTMNAKRRAIGTKRGVPTFTADLEVEMEVGTPEVDWDKLRDDDEKFSIVYQKGKGGLRFAMIDAWVDEVGDSYSQDGQTKCSVKLGMLDHKRG